MKNSVLIPDLNYFDKELRVSKTKNNFVRVEDRDGKVFKSIDFSKADLYLMLGLIDQI